MKLSLEQIQRITTGAVRVEQEAGKLRFYRFTREQTALYEQKTPEPPFRWEATAGIKLSFRTNSRQLKLAGQMLRCTSRFYYAFEVFVNGKPVASIDNFSQAELPMNYTNVTLPLGPFSGEISLGDGEKDVQVYFPWSACPVLEEICLDDGATLSPIRQSKRLLAFGDSITQGYDALRPSMRYVSRLAEALAAEEMNRGIGGEVFFPELAKTKDDICPDYITVAYGTNDFSMRTEPDFQSRCREFFTSLSRNYPQAKIFAITPIWRSDYQGERAFGPFENVESFIRETVLPLPNVTVISGFDLVPKKEGYYADLRLHPNDEGFSHYSENLYREICKHL